MAPNLTYISLKLVHENQLELVTHVSSVKNIAPDTGCILTSSNELNIRPKKLSNKTVALYGGLGFKRTIDDGSCSLPNVANTRDDWGPKGPAPPTTCTTVSGVGIYTVVG